MHPEKMEIATADHNIVITTIDVLIY
jgi:hypothetical protein